MKFATVLSLATVACALPSYQATNDYTPYAPYAGLEKVDAPVNKKPVEKTTVATNIPKPSYSAPSSGSYKPKKLRKCRPGEVPRSKRVTNNNGTCTGGSCPMGGSQPSPSANTTCSNGSCSPAPVQSGSPAQSYYAPSSNTVPHKEERPQDAVPAYRPSRDYSAPSGGYKPSGGHKPRPAPVQSGSPAQSYYAPSSNTVPHKEERPQDAVPAYRPSRDYSAPSGGYKPSGGHKPSGGYNAPSYDSRPVPSQQNKPYSPAQPAPCASGNCNGGQPKPSSDCQGGACQPAPTSTTCNGTGCSAAPSSTACNGSGCSAAPSSTACSGSSCSAAPSSTACSGSSCSAVSSSTACSGSACTAAATSTNSVFAPASSSTGIPKASASSAAVESASPSTSAAAPVASVAPSSEVAQPEQRSYARTAWDYTGGAAWGATKWLGSKIGSGYNYLTGNTEAAPVEDKSTKKDAATLTAPVAEAVKPVAKPEVAKPEVETVETEVAQPEQRSYARTAWDYTGGAAWGATKWLGGKIGSGYNYVAGKKAEPTTPVTSGEPIALESTHQDKPVPAKSD